MKTVCIAGLWLLTFVGCVSHCRAQEKAGPTQRSHANAVRVLESGIDALGGLENVRRADKVTVNYKAVNHPPGQNAAFDAAPADFRRVGARTLLDYSGARYVSEGQSDSPGGYRFNFRTVIAPRRSFSIDLLRNRRGNEVRNLDERSKSQLKVGMLLEAPHLLLLYARDRAETLRWLGEAEVEGRKYRVISFAAESGAQISLYFEAGTDLLWRVEQLDSHALLGDVRSGQDFFDYRAVGTIKAPRRRLAFYNQFLTGEYEYAEVKLDFADGENLLEVPAGFVEPAPPGAAAPELMRKLGDGVYLIERLGQAYRVMFVEFEDHVMVLEAPTDANVSKAVIRLVRQTVPGKPIRYVSFSHFHFDHTGGLREYIAEGATVVVPAGNKGFVEQVARSKLTLKPDALALNPRPPSVETFGRKRVFTDGKRALELHSIGPTSHVRDMVVFYLPKERILFQGDMFSPLDVGGIPPVIEINRELSKKVQELGLDVETLVAVHSGAVAWRDFRQAVAAGAAPTAGAGLLVMARMDEAQVVLLDGATYQTLATLETGKNPHEVRVSHDGRSAYVAAGKFITAVDLRARKVRATFDLGSYSAHDIRVSRDGRRIWAACARAQAILELDSETGKTLKTYGTEQQGSWFVEVTPDERKLYTPNLEGKSVSVIDRDTGRVKVIRFEHPVYGIDITPDGKQVWVSGRDLSVIDTSTDELIDTLKASEADTGRLRITSDGGRVVLALLKKLAVFDAKTRRLLSETELGARPKVLTLSADGRRAFLTNPAENTFSVVDVVAGRVLGTYGAGQKPDGIGWAN